jgi:hypothetical protein
MMRAADTEANLPRTEDHDRDLRLRAALSDAIGAASSLASTSHSQPTAAYLRVAQPAIDGVLSAAGEPIV